jgi:hypothetical protein
MNLFKIPLDCGFRAEVGREPIPVSSNTVFGIRVQQILVHDHERMFLVEDNVRAIGARMSL